MHRSPRRAGPALLATGLLLGTGLSAQAPTVPDGVRAHLRAEIDAGERMGVVVGVVDRHGTGFFAYGQARAGEAQPLDERSVFEIGSISKTFTGILLADLSLRGQPRLEDPVQSLLPDEVEMPDRDGEPITLLHLATHRSSLPRLPANLAPRDRENPYADYTVEQMYRFLNRHDLRRPIGSEFEYSNLGVGLLGHVLARRAGTTYEALLRARITGPLGMADTRIELTDELAARLARGHAGTAEVKNWDIPTLAGAGAIRSTAADMLRYLAANMGLLEESEATAPVLAAMRLSQERRADAGGDTGIGLGWLLMPRDDRLITWHNGGTGGYRSCAGFNDRGLGVVVLSNTNASVDAVGLHVLDPSVPLPQRREPVEVPREILEGHVGQYELTPEFVITVRLREAGLTLQATGQPELGLTAASPTEFDVVGVEASVTFEQDDTGRTFTLVLHQGGMDQRAVRR